MFSSAMEAVEALAGAYYTKRDVKAMLACVSEDILWVGTEKEDYARGKDALCRLLQGDMAAFPEGLSVEWEEPVVQQLAGGAALVSAGGRQTALPGLAGGLRLRVTALCTETPEGWLVSSLHASVPNAESEKHSLAQELDETRKKEQTLMACIPGGVSIYRLKKDGRAMTEYASEGVAKMLGYDTVAEYMDLVREDALVNLVPEDVEEMMRSALASVAKKEPVCAIYRVYTKDHHELLIRLDGNVMSSARLGEDDVLTIYAVHTKVSEESQNTMKEQQHYRTVLDMLGLAYWEWSRAGGFYASEKYADYALSAFPLDQVRDNQALDGVVHPEDLPLLRGFFAGGDRHERRSTVVLRMKTKEGDYRWTEIIGFKEYAPSGETLRMSCVMRDVDKAWQEQRRQLQEALDAAENASRAKTELLSRVSHDMRTPLNGILGMTALVKSNITDEKIQRDLSQLELSGHYLLNLINDTLDVSRIESGRLELHPRVCDGRTVFNNVLALLRPNLLEKHIRLSIHADNLPFTMLYIDVGRVEQIVMNIVGNAVKFTPEGGQIDFSMRNLSVENNIITDLVTVQDDGIGMAEDFLPHLFEPFSQENSSIKNANQGTGLGMAITKQLVELMSGELRVQSAPGKGTRVTFTIQMPIATDEQILQWKKDRVEGSAPEKDLLQGKRVLLCEDHPLNVEIATRLLKSKGIEVEHAANGKLGLELFARSAGRYYDAILMDIRMPVMDGLEAARAIRALPRPDALTVPIIAMTANAFDEDVRQTGTAGMNAHLSKPIETEKLYRTLEELLKVEPGFQRKKVLVVDDVEVNRAVIRQSIYEDYDVYEAENGRQALEILEKRKGIDAVVTDIQMPEMDGVELIRRIREKPEYRHVAIIANTQFGNPSQEEQLLALVANDFVYKPTTPKIVELRLHNALLRI